MADAENKKPVYISNLDEFYQEVLKEAIGALGFTWSDRQDIDVYIENNTLIFTSKLRPHTSYIIDLVKMGRLCKNEI